MLWLVRHGESMGNVADAHAQQAGAGRLDLDALADALREESLSVVVLTAGPARMADNFLVDLPYPRTLDMKTQEVFGEYTRRIYKLLGME